MRLKLVQVGEPTLREPCSKVSLEEIRSTAVQELIASMRDTLRDAPGVGLAAPQVGIAIQLAIVEDLPEYSKHLSAEELVARDRRPIEFHVLINPRLTTFGEPDVDFFESCLSLSGFAAIVPRAKTVRVECLDENGVPRVIEASGWYARILQHETDHLNSTLYIDRMYSRSFMNIENYNRYWKQKHIEDIKRLLLGLHSCADTTA